MHLRIAPDAATAAADAADWVAGRLRNAVRRRGAATIAVSGGRTPAAMFAALATLDVPWASVTVFQVDERVAPDGDPARNATLLDLLPLAAARRRLMAVTGRDLPRAARRYAAALPERFDVVHLGLGDDGHTASWPPGDPVVEEQSPVALSGEYRGHVRMTLTPRVVNAGSAPVTTRHRAVVVLDAAAAALLPAPSG